MGLDSDLPTKVRGYQIGGVALRSLPSRVVGFWLVRLVLFALPPALVLLAMNLVWTAHIANIGCIGSGDRYRVDRLFLSRPGATPGCELPDGTTRSANQPFRIDRLQRWDRAFAAQAEPARGRTGYSQVAIADGRFEWMTFHLIALVLFCAVVLVSVVLMHRNLGGRWRAWLMIAAGAAGGLFWAIYSVGSASELRMDTASLLVPTRVHALSHFDAAFRDMAWANIRWDYGGGLAVTILLLVAAGSILADTGRDSPLSDAAVRARRRDLKLVIATAAVLLTFLAFYVGEWLAWPARFAPGGEGRGSEAEFRAVASGLRLYFGTGYSLALIAFAVPAILALPRPAGKAGAVAESEAGRRPADPAADAPEEHEGYLNQLVFSKDELSMLISVMTPFGATLVGGTLQL